MSLSALYDELYAEARLVSERIDLILAKSRQIKAYMDRQRREGNEKKYDRELAACQADLNTYKTLLVKFNKRFNVEIAVSRSDLFIEYEPPEAEAGNLTLEELKRFYPKLDPTQYPMGKKGRAEISHVHDPDQALVFLLDIDSALYKRVFSSLQKAKDLKEIKTAPLSGLFAICMDGFIIRGVLVGGRQQKRQQTFIRVLFIDIGEVADVNLADTKIFELPPLYKSIPAQALLSCVNAIRGVKDKREFLASFELKDDPIIFEYEIVATKDDILQVIIKDATTSSVRPPTPPPSSSFLNNNHSKNPFLDLSEDEEDEKEVAKKTNCSELTPAQRRAFFEDNPEEAPLDEIFGYTGQDEARFCPLGKSCFKRHCKKEHDPILPDGWTRDQEQILIDIPAKRIVPAAGSEIVLHPIVLISPCDFFAQISGKATENQRDNFGFTLLDLNLLLKENEAMNRLRPFNDKLPADCQLVIARYPRDGNIYRARIVNICNENKYDVFYVDYGNSCSVSRSDLYHWDDAYSTLPAQAFHCRLANICETSDAAKGPKAMAKMKEMLGIKNSAGLKLGAKVVAVKDVDTLEVLVVDENGFDIGETMIASGLAASNATKVPKGEFQIPG